MPFWGDLNARARGLATHLLGRERLGTLATAGTVENFTSLLATFDPRVPRRGDAIPQDLGLYFRRGAADHLATIARWCGPRVRLLVVLFEDEDRRSIRALLRGALQSGSPEERLAGLIPTPSLPLRALDELARCGTAADVVRHLASWRSPYAEPLLTEAKKHQPDLLALELSINATFAARARAGARRGGAYLKHFVRRVVDLENVWTTAVLAERGGASMPERFFLEGGDRLSSDTFRMAVDRTDEWRAILAGAFGGSPLVTVVEDGRASMSLESRCLVALLMETGRAALLDPLGAAPLLAFVLRLRAQLLDLRSLVWGILLGADGHRLEASLITPW